MRLQAFNASAIAAIALVTVCTSSAWFLLDDDDRERSTAPTYWTAEKNYNFKDETKLLSERDFQRIFRLHRRGFDDVLGRIESSVQATRCNSRKAGPIPADVKLAVTLRYLAGGSL